MTMWTRLVQLARNLFCAPESADTPQQPAEVPPQRSQQPQRRPILKPPTKDYQASAVYDLSIANAFRRC